MLPYPIGAKHIGREHNARCNLHKFAHLRMFLSGLNVEVSRSIPRAAVPHFDAVSGEGSPSILDDHLSVWKYFAVSHCLGRQDRPFTAYRPIISIMQG
jgi:hypothetical protein